MKNKGDLAARNNLFPQKGTSWICIKKYPTTGILGKFSFPDSINPGDEVIFLAVKSRWLASSEPKRKPIHYWEIWLLHVAIPVCILWWADLPLPGEDKITLFWEEFFQKA